MREKLMAGRMRYLQSAIRQLRNFVTTEELSRNRPLLIQFGQMERQLKDMEYAYVHATTD